mmetsp:Transcript_14781/g.27814  ORF Transcript_14781/g.27814 Transcript_14781/m.27814 type:complete len:924 (-) Transcript_14781:1703-4474(-)
MKLVTMNCKADLMLQQIVLLLCYSYMIPRSSSFSTNVQQFPRQINNNGGHVVLPFVVPLSSRRSDSNLFRPLSRPLGNVRQTSLNSQVLPSMAATDVNIARVEEEERKLLSLIQLYKDSNASSKKPSSSSFVSLIEKWLAYPYPERAEAILDKMEELYTPSGRIYEKIINAWAFRAIEGINEINSEWVKSSLTEEEVGVAAAAATDDVDQGLMMMEEDERIKKMNRIREEAIQCSSKATQLLNRMEQLHREIGDDFRPALSTYTSVINAIARSSQKDETSLASQRDMIERIRAKRDEIYKQYEQQRIPIRSVEDVLSTSIYIQNLANADQILSKLKLDEEQQSPVPNRFNFNIIINALAQTGEIWAAQAAEDILDVMISEFQKGKFQLAPNLETFNGCMNAWAHCCSTEQHEDDAAFRVEGILDKLTMLRGMSSKNGTLSNLAPDTVTYNTIIKAYANRSDTKRAESILERLVSLYQKTGEERLRPDLISYSTVLNAYAKAAALDANASKKSEEILMKMISMQKEMLNEGDDRIVNNWCFNTVLNAYAAQGAGARASSLLSLMETMGESDEMLKPDTYSYNTVLKALANSNEKGSVERARQILEKMERRHANGDISVKPDAITYNTVILAYGNNGGIGAGNEAKDIVERMQNRFIQGDLECKPTSSTYTSLIKAFNWETDSIHHAEEVLLSLKSYPDSETTPLVSPDTPIYNAVLNCWAKNGSRGAVQRAEEILSEMKKEYHENGNDQVKPNCRTYTTIIDILAKSGEKEAPQRSLEILDEMETQYEAGDMDSKPNVFTYTAAINCFARSKDKNKAVQAVNILERMEEQYRKGNDSARPNVIAYNSVLNACAYTANEADAAETAFKIACLVFDEVRTSCHVQPTHVSSILFVEPHTFHYSFLPSYIILTLSFPFTLSLLFKNR